MKVFVILALFMVSRAAGLTDDRREVTPLYRQQTSRFGARSTEGIDFYHSFSEDGSRLEPENRRQFDPESSRYFPNAPSYSELPNYSMERDPESDYQPTPFKFVYQPLIYNPYTYNYMSAAMRNYHYQLF
ncbi:uncharacterized protein LOC111624780 [Centruroides sculpturatus]|uniref:uncharacterized protein LOC111624780 n=1 Tax=Centruroides sculpturatus TaxID=218467 RepID=UPI000C6E3078|nr:uncharacterized protein LOC111624780 [Centruroides sculpturatus]XP_023223487.1 uncharacterized protein LOC111624780 [Centruroides sculpturatus]